MATQTKSQKIVFTKTEAIVVPIIAAVIAAIIVVGFHLVNSGATVMGIIE